MRLTLKELNELSNSELDAKLSALLGIDRWYVVKRGMFYRPNARGYTYDEREAWALPRAEALTHVYAKGGADERVTITQAPVRRYTMESEYCREVELALKPERYSDVAERGSYYSQQMRYAERLERTLRITNVNLCAMSGNALAPAHLFPVITASARVRTIALISTLTPEESA